MRPLTVRVVMVRDEPPPPRRPVVSAVTGIVLILLITDIVRHGRR